MTISRWYLLKMRNFQTHLYTNSKQTFYVQLHFPQNSCHLWVNVDKYGRVGEATDDSIILRMRFACWVINATNTDSMLHTYSSSRQQWLCERSSILPYTYITSLVAFCPIPVPISRLAVEASQYIGTGFSVTACHVVWISCCYHTLVYSVYPKIMWIHIYPRLRQHVFMLA